MNRRVLYYSAALIAMVLTASSVEPVSAQPAGPPRMNKETLRGLLGGPDLLILDVRVDNDWRNSDAMIKDAVRKPPELFAAWSSDVPQDKTVVLYCA